MNEMQMRLKKYELALRRETRPDYAACDFLIAMWLLTTVIFAIMFFGGVRNTGQFRVARYIVPAVYALVLFWYLSRIPPFLTDT